jgi:hypothetical protein
MKALEEKKKEEASKRKKVTRNLLNKRSSNDNIALSPKKNAPSSTNNNINKTNLNKVDAVITTRQNLKPEHFKIESQIVPSNLLFDSHITQQS